MDYLNQIQKGINFIERNLDSSIEISEVAKRSGMSQWHFQRIFKALSGETLKKYIRTRRLGKSLDLLKEGQTRILDIAIISGFESQETFTRAFKKEFNLNPGEYRRLEKKPSLFKKVKFDISYLEHLKKGLSMEPEIYEQKKITIVGLKTKFFGSDSEKNNVALKLPPLWQDFLSQLNEVNDVQGKICYGVVSQIDNNTDELEYYCGVEVKDPNIRPKNFKRIDIAQNTYAKFEHKGSIDQIDNTINYIYSTWLPQSGKKHTQNPDLEFYGSSYDPNSEESIMYYAIPIG